MKDRFMASDQFKNAYVMYEPGSHNQSFNYQTLISIQFYSIFFQIPLRFHTIEWKLNRIEKRRWVDPIIASSKKDKLSILRGLIKLP